jgi:hypothetical protein
LTLSLTAGDDLPLASFVAGAGTTSAGREAAFRAVLGDEAAAFGVASEEAGTSTESFLCFPLLMALL